VTALPPLFHLARGKDGKHGDAPQEVENVGDRGDHSSRPCKFKTLKDCPNRLEAPCQTKQSENLDVEQHLFLEFSFAVAASWDRTPDPKNLPCNLQEKGEVDRHNAEYGQMVEEKKSFQWMLSNNNASILLSNLWVKQGSPGSNQMKRGQASCEEERQAKSNDQVDVCQGTSVLVLTIPQQVDR